MPEREAKSDPDVCDRRAWIREKISKNRMTLIANGFQPGSGTSE